MERLVGNDSDTWKLKCVKVASAKFSTVPAWATTAYFVVQNEANDPIPFHGKRLRGSRQGTGLEPRGLARFTFG